MVVNTPGDPRDFLPLARLRREILGDASISTEDDQFSDHVESAVSSISAELGADVADRTLNALMLCVDRTETLRINRRWIRSVDSISGKASGAVAGYTVRADRGGVSIEAPPEGWPDETLTVEATVGLDTTDRDFGLVRQAAVVQIRAWMDGYREQKPTAAAKRILDSIRTGAYRPERTKDAGLRDDDFSPGA